MDEKKMKCMDQNSQAVSVHLPRIMIAAEKSGGGKTLFTCALLSLLKEKIQEVRAFKCGPDYIDPMFHRTVLEIPSRNLDSFFADEDTLRYLLGREVLEMEKFPESRIAVLEGVMGFYDGLGGVSERSSAWEVADLTDTPVILLVDMGSLEQIHSQMGGLRNLNIGIINNISTALAVDIGLGICGNQKLEDILKRASESNVCTYRIIHNVQKEDAVIFSGENGIDTTEKLKELILKTSATSIPVKFVAYDYYRLMKNGSHDEIFQQYHVKCIIGLFNPEIEGIPFISLEDIISMNSAEKLTNIFSEYLDEEQMEVFNQNLVKNFSLQNVVESITILNPDKLLDEVEQAVGRLQKITGRKIAGRIMIGLYVHLCCLVERLVTKTPIDNYQDLEEFEQKHADFIRQVRDSFQDISRHYRVALPVSEIAYIYDYMHLNSKNKLSGQAESPAVREDE